MSKYTCEKLKKILLDSSEDKKLRISKEIGYPVFLRMCFGEELQHIVPILQDGAAAIIVNEKGQVLLQDRKDNDKWGLPGGCQELGDTFEQTICREIKEETNLDVEEKDLSLITVVSGQTRRNSYPNGDIVFNNTVLYLVTKYSGKLKVNDNESKKLKWFDIDNLPKHQNDPDLIEAYKSKILSKRLNN